MASKRKSRTSAPKISAEKVKVAVTDIDGVLRGKYLNRDKFLSAAQGGFGFCDVVLGWDSADVCYDNAQITGWHTGYPDAWVRIDPSTQRQIPWDQNLPFFLCEFVKSDGSPHACCPRQLLKRVVAKAEKMGYLAKCGMEFEWFNFQETPQTLSDKKYLASQFTPLTPGMFGYSVLRQAANQPFFAAIMDELKAFGVPIEGLHTETGPGVYEAAILYSDALEAADRAVLFKSGVREIGYRFGILASFMAKWNASLPGCSGHIHQSLWNKKGDRNLFFDSKAENKMSPLFESYVAGQLALLPEFLTFYAPTVNSYKRLVDGFWAPTKATWGVDNRTVAFRVLPGSEKSTRVEVRISGSDSNPYLAIAASLASGLYGIEQGLKLTDAPVRGSAYTESDAPRLPRNLGEATELLKNSTVAPEVLGEEFVDHYARTRDWEWRQYQTAVTNWEIQRYFEII